MSMADVGTEGALPDPVSTMVIEVLSKVKGGTFLPPRSIGAS